MTLKENRLYLSACKLFRCREQVHVDWQELMFQNAYLDDVSSLAMYSLSIPVQRSTN